MLVINVNFKWPIFLNSEDTGMENTKILRHKTSNEYHSLSKWTSKKYVIGALGTDAAHIPWDFYIELQIIIIKNKCI